MEFRSKISFRTPRLLLIVLLLGMSAGQVDCQQRFSLWSDSTAAGLPARESWGTNLDSSRTAPVVSLALAGTAGTVFGIIGGVYLGAQVNPCTGCEDPGLLGALSGYFFGPALLTPLAVHSANGSRGDIEDAYLSSFGIAVIGIVGLLAGGDAASAFLIAAPFAQVVSAVHVIASTD